MIGIERNIIAISIDRLWVNTVYIVTVPKIPALIINEVQKKIIKIIQFISHILYLNIELKKLLVILVLLPLIMENDYSEQKYSNLF